MRLKIKVRAVDIKTDNHHPCHCPVAQAIKRTLKADISVTVTGAAVRVKDVYIIHKGINAWVDGYDNADETGKVAKPREFTITVPKEWVK